MRSYHQRGHSGPHSINDARQHAWALLVLGPGAPAPRQRPHRGSLPDMPDAVVVRRPSLFARLAGLFRKSPGAVAPEEAEQGGDQHRRIGGVTPASVAENTEPDDRLAA